MIRPVLVSLGFAALGALVLAVLVYESLLGVARQVAGNQADVAGLMHTRITACLGDFTTVRDFLENQISIYPHEDVGRMVPMLRSLGGNLMLSNAGYKALRLDRSEGGSVLDLRLRTLEGVEMVVEDQREPAERPADDPAFRAAVNRRDRVHFRIAESAEGPVLRLLGPVNGAAGRPAGVLVMDFDLAMILDDFGTSDVEGGRSAPMPLALLDAKGNLLLQRGGILPEHARLGEVRPELWRAITKESTGRTLAEGGVWIFRTVDPTALLDKKDQSHVDYAEDARPLRLISRLKAADLWSRLEHSILVLAGLIAGGWLLISTYQFAIAVGRRRQAELVEKLRAANERLATSLTEEKRLLGKARAAENAKSEFLAVMSHELRTPMNSVIGFANLLAGTPLNKEQHEHIAAITDSGEMLLSIISEILDLSRIESGQLELQTSTFSTAEILRRAITPWRLPAGEKGLTLEAHCDPGVPTWLRGDEWRLRQILNNLIGNAVKFTERGFIRVSVHSVTPPVDDATGRAWLEFVVADSGQGISEDGLQRVFEPFVQADSSISRRHGGAGLGLAIVKKLAQLLGGVVEASSRVGEGSRFLVRLPFEVPAQVDEAAAAADGAAVADVGFASRHPMRILVAEDNATNRRLMQILLGRLGYEVSLAGDGEEAVRVHAENPPDCILMDMQMPKMDGLQASREIRRREAENPGLRRTTITALTANALGDARQECRAAGMDDFLTKPIVLPALASHLAVVHARRAGGGA